MKHKGVKAQKPKSRKTVKFYDRLGNEITRTLWAYKKGWILNHNNIGYYFQRTCKGWVTNVKHSFRTVLDIPKYQKTLTEAVRRVHYTLVLDPRDSDLRIEKSKITRPEAKWNF